MIKNNSQKYQILRQEYNVFTYEKFEYVLTSSHLRIKYTFNLSDRYCFEPEMIVHLKDDQASAIPTALLENLVFSIGMIELISYWKAACPPLIIVRPFQLDEAQVRFWKKIYFHGLGEFFHLNGIQASEHDFVMVESRSAGISRASSATVRRDRVLVPVGGGKDSIVTLELLKDEVDAVPFAINPRGAIRETILHAGFLPEEIITVERTIHPQLLELNNLGFLNGHTPFSALVAFVSILAAALTQSRFVALSNEASANEPTVAGGANHQYSKSLDFENDFRNYSRRYLTPDIVYFSFLRPLHEIGIARLFSRHPGYFDKFKSCNVGSKEDKWCGSCPKCLFTAVILSPYVGSGEIIKIFGYDILNNPDLVPLLESLAGMTENKPFECVGTIDEVNTALVLAIDRNIRHLPFLLEHYRSTPAYGRYRPMISGNRPEINEAHFLPDKFLQILKSHVDAEGD